MNLRPAQPTLIRPDCFEVSWDVCYLVYVLKNPLFRENAHHSRAGAGAGASSDHCSFFEFLEFLFEFLAVIFYECPLKFLESLSMSALPQGLAVSLKDPPDLVFASDILKALQVAT